LPGVKSKALTDDYELNEVRSSRPSKISSYGSLAVNVITAIASDLIYMTIIYSDETMLS